MWLYLQKAPSCSWGHTPLGWLYGDRLLSGWRWFDVASIDMSLSKLWELVMDSGMLQFMGLQRIGHNRATALNWTDVAFSPSQGSLPYLCLPSRFFFFFYHPTVCLSLTWTISLTLVRLVMDASRPRLLGPWQARLSFDKTTYSSTFDRSSSLPEAFIVKDAEVERTWGGWSWSPFYSLGKIPWTFGS